MPQEVVHTGLQCLWAGGDCGKSVLNSGALIAVHCECWVGEGLGAEGWGDVGHCLGEFADCAAILGAWEQGRAE